MPRYLFAACLFPLCTSLAWSQSTELMDEFRALDLNGDGLVSEAEAAGNAEVVTKFGRADRNLDGKLSFVEYQRLKKLKTRTAKKDRDKGSATGATARRAPGKAAD
jgi:hypothetical protein